MAGYTPPEDWSETEIVLKQYDSPIDWSETEIILKPKASGVSQELISDSVDKDTLDSVVTESIKLISDTSDADTVTSQLTESQELILDSVDKDTVSSDITAKQALISGAGDKDVISTDFTFLISKPDTISESIEQGQSGVYFGSPATPGEAKERQGEETILVNAPDSISSESEEKEDLKDYPSTTSEAEEVGTSDTYEPSNSTVSRNIEE